MSVSVWLHAYVRAALPSSPWGVIELWADVGSQDILSGGRSAADRKQLSMILSFASAPLSSQQ